jgi:3-hydroxybutyryl-CoA dehydrogenase
VSRNSSEARLPVPEATTAPELPASVAVIGAGTMGTGIAIVFAAAGCADLRLMSRHEATLRQAASRIAGAALLPDSRAGAIRLTTSLAEAAGGSELIIESISEDLDAKVGLLRSVEACVPDSAILASNTSSVPIDDLAAGLARPGRFAGYHCFNPPEMIELVEVVSGRDTAAETIGQLCRWAVSAGRAPIHVRRAVPGFIANRLQYALLREAFALVEDGVCGYADVDEVVRMSIGARWAAIGPVETMDLAGLDVHAAVASRLYPELASNATVPPAVLKMVSDGALGCKTGRGLRGNYSAGDVARIEARRDRVLLALRALRERERT